MKKITLLAISALIVAPLGFVNGATNANSTVQTDEKLTKDIKDKVSSGWFIQGYDQVIVNVKNGHVTLDGTVQTADDKIKVEKEVRNMDGVRSLTSNIKPVEAGKKVATTHPQDTASTSADEQLNLKIRDQISGWIWDSYDGVSLNTANGVVELRGQVNDLKNQQDLMNKIQDVEGVKSVKSSLRLNK
jgi:osmotically-inducible protein OsmY